MISLVLYLICVPGAGWRLGEADAIARALWVAFFILLIIAGIVAWFFVLAHESRRVAQEESARQTTLLLKEIDAHRRTDAQLQRAKEVAEAANLAKSRYVVGLSHELRTPLNAVLGYAQILERDEAMPPARQNGVRVIRRSAEHLSGLIDGLLDISKIEAGRFQLQRNESALRRVSRAARRHVPPAGRGQGPGVPLRARRTTLPEAVRSDEKRLRQILINLLSNAIKFTEAGHVALAVTYRSQIATFIVRGHAASAFRPDDRSASSSRSSAASSVRGDARPRPRPDHHQAAGADHGRRDRRRQRRRPKAQPSRCG